MLSRNWLVKRESVCWLPSFAHEYYRTEKRLHTAPCPCSCASTIDACLTGAHHKILSFFSLFYIRALFHPFIQYMLCIAYCATTLCAGSGAGYHENRDRTIHISTFDSHSAVSFDRFFNKLSSIFRSPKPLVETESVRDRKRVTVQWKFKQTWEEFRNIDIFFYRSSETRFFTFSVDLRLVN